MEGMGSATRSLLLLVAILAKCNISHQTNLLDPARKTPPKAFKKYEGMALMGIPMHREIARSAMECCMACSRYHCSCHSVNAIPLVGSSQFTCEFFNESASMDQFALKLTTDGLHFKYKEEPRNGYELVSANEVCFGARDDSFGVFSFGPCSGSYRVKLVHQSGLVTCVGNKPPRPFGCGGIVNRVVLTTSQADNEVVVSHTDLSESDGNAATSTYVATTECFTFTGGEVYRMWFDADLRSISESDNEGTSCVLVYANKAGCTN